MSISSRPVKNIRISPGGSYIMFSPHKHSRHIKALQIVKNIPLHEYQKRFELQFQRNLDMVLLGNVYPLETSYLPKKL